MKTTSLLGLALSLLLPNALSPLSPRAAGNGCGSSKPQEVLTQAAASQLLRSLSAGTQSEMIDLDLAQEILSRADDWVRESSESCDFIAFLHGEIEAAGKSLHKSQTRNQAWQVLLTISSCLADNAVWAACCYSEDSIPSLSNLAMAYAGLVEALASYKESIPYAVRTSLAPYKRLAKTNLKFLLPHLS
ncbi:hypothetical protein EBZ39_11835 [bacterium]|nr:hypothetical protein [bacterium]